MPARKALVIALLAILLSSITAGTGCARRGARGTPSDKQAGDAPVTGGTIVWAGLADIAGMNPILVQDTASRFVSDRLFLGLIAFDPVTLSPVPRLARNWDISPDGTEYTFYLRDDVFWHDGQRFTAEDVKFTYEAVQYPFYEGARASGYDRLKGAAAYQARLRDLQKMRRDKSITDEEYRAEALEAFVDWRSGDAIQVVDAYTVRFRLESPFAPFLVRMDLGIIPRHAFKDIGEAGRKDHPFNSETPVGTGPFRFAERKSDRLVLERNPRFFLKDRPYVDRLVYVIIPDQVAATMALETGDVDVFSFIKPEDVNRFQTLGHIRLFEYLTPNYTYLAFNLRDERFEDVSVRRAFVHAIDRKALVDYVLMGHGALANTHGTPLRWDYNPDVVQYEYNPQKARELLAAAGWRDTDGDGILDREGRPFRISLKTNAENSLREQSAVIIKEQLGEVGIAVDVQVTEWRAFVEKVLLGKDFDTVIVGWSLEPDPDDAYPIWHTRGGPYNFIGYSQPEVDQLLERGRAAVSQEERRQVYRQVQAILAEEAPYVFLFFANNVAGVNTRVKGQIQGSPLGIEWNIEEWWVKK